MFDFKQISAEAIPRALAKAERYRLLNEPEEAESICEDVLRIDQDNQQAIVTLVLSLTDSFFHVTSAGRFQQARELLERLKGPYEQAYYAGIICERWAKAQHYANRASPFVYSSLREAMAFYEKAEALSPPGNDDSVLRWNACVRFIESSDELRSGGGDFQAETAFRDDVPPS
jgi:tetratricopeptide (TPR) repeat protein